jgi:hypothetical protein
MSALAAYAGAVDCAYWFGSAALAGPRLDMTILNDAPPALQHRVIRDGRLLFASDEGRRVEFETRVIQEFLDFQPVLERYDRGTPWRLRSR